MGWSGVELSGVERCRVKWGEKMFYKWSGVEWSGAEPSGVEPSGVEWSRVELRIGGWSLVVWGWKIGEWS